VLATKGDPVAYGPETRFTFSLAGPLDLPVYKELKQSEMKSPGAG
jgi:hypothetical protein